MTTRRRTLLVPFALLLLLIGAGPLAGQAIMGTAGDGNLGVVFPTPGVGLPNPSQTNITGLPAGSLPHGVSAFGNDRAVLSDFGNSRVFIVQISTASLLSTIDTTPFNGTGTVAASPALDAIICAGSFSATGSSAAIVKNPLSGSPTVTALSLKGIVRSYQTEAISFNPQGRAFIWHTNGISVLDPPYDAIAFEISQTNIGGGALAITPDGNTLLCTDSETSGATGNVFVYKAPFSASSRPEILNLKGVAGLDGIMVTPDGTKALTCTIGGGSLRPRVFAISAPFGASSAYEEIPLPIDFVTGDPGLEDVGISPDGQLAIFMGNSSKAGRPALFVKAPFTGAGATVFSVPVLGGGRGAGAVRFIPCATPPAPEIVRILPSGNPVGPVTGSDYLDLIWSPSISGAAPSRYEYRLNGDAYTSTQIPGVLGVPPRASIKKPPDPVTLYVRAYACNPEKGPSAESASPVYSLAPPGASFSPSKTTVKVGEQIIFTDTSSPQATSWLWFFGNFGLLNQQNQTFTATTPGSFGVILVASNGSGSSVSQPVQITVTATAPPSGPRRRTVVDEVNGETAWDGASAWLHPRRHTFLRLEAAQDAVVFVRLERGGAPLVERRIAVPGGSPATVDLAAYLPAGTRGPVDIRFVSDRPVSATLEEEEKP